MARHTFESGWGELGKHRNQRVILISVMLIAVSTAGVLSASVEQTNTCRATADDPCERTGTCSIQGADWFQTVTIDRADIFDTQGWPGLCDMVHVALVQGSCEPPGAQTNVTAILSTSSFAEIPEIVGPLACAGDPLADSGAVPDGGTVPGPPLVVEPGAAGSLVLTWAASCLSTDSDYAVYEGSLGDFASHTPAACSTDGMTTVTLTPTAGNTYYLVVPTNALSEGSHGIRSNGDQRGPGPVTCLPLSVDSCF
jgi:hypothetical protein